MYQAFSFVCGSSFIVKTSRALTKLETNIQFMRNMGGVVRTLNRQDWNPLTAYVFTFIIIYKVCWVCWVLWLDKYVMWKLVSQQHCYCYQYYFTSGLSLLRLKSVNLPTTVVITLKGKCLVYCQETKDMTCHIFPLYVSVWLWCGNVTLSYSHCYGSQLVMNVSHFEKLLWIFHINYICVLNYKQF